jgi:hypothetical protein
LAHGIFKDGTDQSLKWLEHVRAVSWGQIFGKDRFISSTKHIEQLCFPSAPTSYKMSTNGFYPEVRRPELEANNSPPRLYYMPN